MKINSSSIKIIDYLIYFFIVLFLLSLTNSIFVNQLGYYAALILILIKYFLTKENQFEKTGLEFALLWFISAEILSAVFSIDKSAAFNNVLKRILLIPVIYTIIAASIDLRRAKRYFKIYIAASLITVLIYLFFSFQYFINNLYNIKQSGPSLFQYPITASEILSFTVIFLFAFAVNEKTKIFTKILLYAGFILSLLALFSTYKRTGWMGTAFGIFLILILNKQWKILALALILITAVFFMQKNISEVNIYNYDNGNLKKEINFSTEGSAYSILPENGKFYLSDYENGLIKYDGDKQLDKIELPSPIKNFKEWKDNYYIGELFDTRFVLFKKTENGLIKKDIFLTPGFTYKFQAANNFLYIFDADSGLTVFKDPENLKNFARINNFDRSSNFYVDSTFLIVYFKQNQIKIFSLKNFLPEKQIVDYKDESKIDFIFYTGKKLFISDNSGLKLFSIDSLGINLLDQDNSLSKLFYWSSAGGKLFAADLAGNVYEFENPVKNEIKIISKNNIGFSPNSIAYSKNKLYTTFLKQSRLLSIFDVYNPSNFVRFELWRAGWKMFKDYPVFGVGDIDLAQLYKKYKHDYDKEIQGHMHNNFVHILVILGLFGFLAVCYLLLKIFLIDIKILKDVRNIPFISSYALGAAACFSAFIVSGFTEMNIFDHEITTLVFFTFGLNIAFYNLNKRNTENMPDKTS